MINLQMNAFLYVRNLICEKWMPVLNNENVEVNAKFLTRNGVYANGYADQVMSKVRKSLNKKRITVRSFCEYYKLDIGLFEGMK